MENFYFQKIIKIHDNNLIIPLVNYLYHYLLKNYRELELDFLKHFVLTFKKIYSIDKFVVKSLRFIKNIKLYFIFIN